MPDEQQAAATATDATDQSTSTEGTADPKPTETVDFWKAKSREWEAKSKANATAAQKLAEIEDAQKSEAERLTDAANQAKAEAEQARAEALRWKIAAKHGISDADAETFLTASDEDTLTRQAERLAALAIKPDDTSKVPAPRPDLSQGARDTKNSGDPAKDFAAFLGGQMTG